MPAASCRLLFVFSLDYQSLKRCPGAALAYVYVMSSYELGDGIFRACIMYGVFAAIACFHNLYTVIKNVTNLSQEADIVMNTVSLYGMLIPNLTNWTWQTGYLFYLISKVNSIKGKTW